MPECFRPVGAVVSSVALLAAAALTLAAHARMPEAAAAPSTTSTTAPTTASSTTPSAVAGSDSAGSDYPSDEFGFLDSAARCDDSQALMSFGRTSRALVAICVDSDGDLEYRGVRLSDETALTATAGRASDGSIIAINNGVTYAVSPEMLLVSEGDTVLYRDSWLEFGQPRFSDEPTSTSVTSTAATSTAATPTSADAPTTTVSTTTVTVTPESADSGG